MPSYTYGSIQTRIADEINRSDLTSQIGLAIITAIESYERTRFWFNEAIATATTTASQNYVSLPSDFVFEYEFQITVNTNKYRLCPIPYSEFLEKSGTNSSTSQPTHYCYYADVMYLYPSPNSAYTLTLHYIKRLTTLSVSADNNGWTNYAEEMIRQRAKADIAVNVLRDKEAINEAAQFSARGQPFLSGLEKSAFMRLCRENDLRTGVSGQAKAYYL
jgi:hypothetical protein